MQKYITNKNLLYCAYAIAFFCVLVHVLCNVHLYRDCANCYADMIRAFAAGDYEAAFHPSIPVLNVFLGGLLAKIGVPVVASLVAVSGLFYLATLPFLYRQLERFVPTPLAGLGVLLYAAAPKIIRFSCSGLLESSKIFFLVGAFYFLLNYSEKRRWQSAAWFGFMLGGLSLARSEAIGNALILAGIMLLALVWKRESITSWGRVALHGLLAAALWFALLLPRMLWNCHTTGRFIFDRRLADGIGGLFASTAEMEKIAEGVPIAAAPPAEPLVEMLNTLIGQNLRGGYEPYVVFAIIGIVLLALSRKITWLWPEKKVPAFLHWQAAYTFLLLVVAGNAAIHFLGALMAYRYFLLNIPFLMVFTLIGLSWVYAWGSYFAGSRIRQLNLALVLGACVLLYFQVDNGMDNLTVREDYETGNWLRNHLAVDSAEGLQEQKIFFRNASPVWFWTGARRAHPIESAGPDLATFRDFDWLIWGADEDRLEIFLQREDLEEVAVPEDFPVRVFKVRFGGLK